MTKSCVSSFYRDFKFEHERMIKSLLHFHPEVNLEIIERKEFMLLGLDTWGYPLMELPLFKKYSTVTHIDADVIIVDRIDELFDDSTDARAGRNNTDNNRCTTHEGVTLHNIPWHKYVNAGIHSVSSAAFMEEWLRYTKDNVLEYKYGENDTFNIVFHLPKYSTKILDPLEGSIYYGTSIVEGTKTFWDLWRKIVVVGDHLELNNKRIKMLHIAGGLAVRPPLAELVTPEVQIFIDHILTT